MTSVSAELLIPFKLQLPAPTKYSKILNGHLISATLEIAQNQCKLTHLVKFCHDKLEIESPPN